MESLLEGLVGNIEEKESLVLFIDAEKEVQDVEVTTESLEESLIHLGELHFLELSLAL